MKSLDKAEKELCSSTESCHSSQESAHSAKCLLDTQDSQINLELPSSLNQTPTGNCSSKNDMQTSSYTIMSPLLEESQIDLTFASADLPAPTSQEPIPTETDSTESDRDFGGKCSGSLENANQDGLSGKMLVPPDILHTPKDLTASAPSPQLSGVLPSNGIFVNGLLSAQKTWEHPTKEKESCLLPTPMGHARAKTSYSAPGQDKLERKLRELGVVTKGQISSPEFRQWLMGLPHGWTSITEADGGKTILHQKELVSKVEVFLTEENKSKPSEMPVPPNRVHSHGNVSSTYPNLETTPKRSEPHHTIGLNIELVEDGDQAQGSDNLLPVLPQATGTEDFPAPEQQQWEPVVGNYVAEHDYLQAVDKTKKCQGRRVLVANLELDLSIAQSPTEINRVASIESHGFNRSQLIEFEAWCADISIRYQELRRLVQQRDRVEKDSDNWYTPQNILELVIQVMGSIDLDPCSNPQKTVQASLHYTFEQDGLVQPWCGRVYVNPPYSCPGVWIQKLEQEYYHGLVTEAIALVPAATDTKWLSPIMERGEQPICFWKGRIKFLDKDLKKQHPARQSHCLIYYGENQQKFKQVFAPLGVISGGNYGMSRELAPARSLVTTAKSGSFAKNEEGFNTSTDQPARPIDQPLSKNALARYVQGNISDRQDIKFGQSDVEIADILSWVEASVASSATIGVELALSIPMPNSIPTRKSASLRLFQDERDRWLSLLEQVAPNKTQPEQMTALLEWIERHDLERTVESESAAQQVETKAWEKITALTEVLTRLVGHFEQQVAANSPGTDIEKSPHNTTRSTVSTAAKLSSKGQRSHQTEAEATDSTKSHNRHQSHPTRSMKADKRVNQAINQIIKHNSTPDLPHNQKWAITLSVLKAATQSSQAVINRVLVTRQQEIDQHHQEHELGAYHNSLHRKTGAKITSIVC